MVGKSHEGVEEGGGTKSVTSRDICAALHHELQEG